MIQLTSTNFTAEVLKCPAPILVYFWASWCGPCKAIAPMLETLSREMEESIAVGKLNVEEHATIAEHYMVMTLPTFLLFKDGVVINQFIGTATKTDLKEKILRTLEERY